MPGEHAALILYNEGGQILLQLRSEYKKRYASHWGVFGGKIELGETPEEALIREMQEELNYETREAIKFRISPEVDGLPQLHLFYERYDGTRPITLDPRESQEMRWFAIEEIEALDPMIPMDKRDVLDFAYTVLKQEGKG